jgi:hypothetical protein
MWKSAWRSDSSVHPRSRSTTESQAAHHAWAGPCTHRTVAKYSRPELCLRCAQIEAYGLGPWVSHSTVRPCASCMPSPRFNSAHPKPLLRYRERRLPHSRLRMQSQVRLLLVVGLLLFRIPPASHGAIASPVLHRRPLARHPRLQCKVLWLGLRSCRSAVLRVSVSPWFPFVRFVPVPLRLRASVVSVSLSMLSPWPSC